MTTQIDTNNIQPSTLQLTTRPKVATIQVTNSSYVVLNDTAVNTLGGYIQIAGANFVAGAQVYIGNSLATSVSVASSGIINAQVPATAAGSYDVIVVNTNGSYCIKPIGITFSPVNITWVTSSSLGPYQTGVAISLQLSATGATGYQLQSGSTLPTGLTLSSGGLLSGTVNVGSDTTYTFTIEAYDSELQDAPRTFSLSIVLNAPPSTVEYLVVAGGASGGGHYGGGGGAGGYRTASGFAITTGVQYTVTVGAGGANVTGYAGGSGLGNAGSNSVFSSITSTGGGGGGARGGSQNGATGGSGGGGAGGIGGTSGGSPTAGQGFAGAGGLDSGGSSRGGGGGGAAEAGNTDGQGQGGDGLSSSISGSATFYAGGGGGGSQDAGGAVGGDGGGGLGGSGNGNGTAGTTNTGGGGGGAAQSEGGSRSGAGGSGIVIIRYLDTFSAATATTGSPTISVTGGYRIYKYTGSGSITF